jgi:hypothetical protein
MLTLPKRDASSRVGPMDQPASFDSTPEFAYFKEQIRKLIAVPAAL